MLGHYSIYFCNVSDGTPCRKVLRNRKVIEKARESEKCQKKRQFKCLNEKKLTFDRNEILLLVHIEEVIAVQYR